MYKKSCTKMYKYYKSTNVQIKRQPLIMFVYLITCKKDRYIS